MVSEEKAIQHCWWEVGEEEVDGGCQAEEAAEPEEAAE